MPKHDVAVECQVPRSFRVDQVRGMFDLKAEKTAREEFHVELPGDDEPWQIGVIVGPSGSGKSTVAREAYGERFVERFEWPHDKAVVDGFDAGLSIKDVTAVLTAVGFSTPPCWVKPYPVLSGGQKFRCDLARALVEDRGRGRPGSQGLVAFDEFTSVVDRTVAKCGSAAVSKAIRKGAIQKRFVAVTCHYDVIEWLEPDWVLDMASQQLARGGLWRRPPIELQIATVHHSAWRLFRRHHYLNTALSRIAKCFVAFWGEEPVAFSAWLPAMTRHRRTGDMREHRTVVLPDFQGVGIGNRVSELCASIFAGVGGRSFSTTSHPSMIGYRSRSAVWKRKRLGRVPKDRRIREESAINQSSSFNRVTAGFEYTGSAMERPLAEAMLAARPRCFDYDLVATSALAMLQQRRETAHLPASIARQVGCSRDEVRSALEKLAVDELVARVRVAGRNAWRAA